MIRALLLLILLWTVPAIAEKDCAHCPEMVVVPEGRFAMGATPAEEERTFLPEGFRNRSQPIRNVSVKPFAVGKFEVTRGEYRVFIEATGRSGDGCWVWGWTEVVSDPSERWRNPGYAQDDTHPVTCVSWEDASAYVAWLTQQAGRRYRLLTESEWEYAARAGTTTTRYWGDEASVTCAYANGADRSSAAQVPGASDWYIADCDDRFAYTAPVGRYRPNAFGLHDMLGNAEEWVQDCWKADYTGAPADSSAGARPRARSRVSTAESDSSAGMTCSWVGLVAVQKAATKRPLAAS